MLALLIFGHESWRCDFPDYIVEVLADLVNLVGLLDISWIVPELRAKIPHDRRSLIDAATIWQLEYGQRHVHLRLERGPISHGYVNLVIGSV